jgi:hypothetical protein
VGLCSDSSFDALEGRIQAMGYEKERLPITPAGLAELFALLFENMLGLQSAGRARTSDLCGLSRWECKFCRGRLQPGPGAHVWLCDGV